MCCCRGRPLRAQRAACAALRPPAHQKAEGGRTAECCRPRPGWRRPAGEVVKNGGWVGDSWSPPSAVGTQPASPCASSARRVGCAGAARLLTHSLLCTKASSQAANPSKPALRNSKQPLATSRRTPCTAGRECLAEMLISLLAQMTPGTEPHLHIQALPPLQLDGAVSCHLPTTAATASPRNTPFSRIQIYAPTCTSKRCSVSSSMARLAKASSSSGGQLPMDANAWARAAGGQVEVAMPNIRCREREVAAIRAQGKRRGGSLWLATHLRCTAQQRRLLKPPQGEVSRLMTRDPAGAAHPPPRRHKGYCVAQGPHRTHAVAHYWHGPHLTGNAPPGEGPAPGCAPAVCPARRGGRATRPRAGARPRPASAGCLSVGVGEASYSQRGWKAQTAGRADSQALAHHATSCSSGRNRTR